MQVPKKAVTEEVMVPESGGEYLSGRPDHLHFPSTLVFLSHYPLALIKGEGKTKVPDAVGNAGLVDRVQVWHFLSHAESPQTNSVFSLGFSFLMGNKIKVV